MSKPFCTVGFPTVPGESSKRPYLIGITGIQGAGKSTVGDALNDVGVFVIDTDHLTHELLDAPSEAYREILERFGADLVSDEGGPIDRKKLRARAFETAETKAALEAIMHPRINELLERKILEHREDAIVAVQVPLLHEAHLKEHFDEVWCIVVKEEIHIERLMARDNLTLEKALEIIKLQMPQEEKLRLSDYSIDNSGTIEETRTQVFKLLADADARRLGATTPPAPPTTPAPAEPVEDPVEDPVEEPVEPPAPDAEVPGSDTGNGGADSDETHHQDVLRKFGHLGTEEALERLGHLSGTKHKEATASLTLKVDSRDGTNDGDPNRSRELQVDVRMSVKNQPGKPADPACPCGCGKDCRVTCACAADCGCSCKKPAPPPPPGPCPGKPGGDHSGCNHDHGHNRRNWFGLGSLIALLAFLAFLAFLAWAWHNHSHNTHVTIVNKPPCCTQVEPPKPPQPPLPPVDPPTPPVGTCQPGTTQTLTEVPGYGFRFVHNHVREKVTKWEESYAADCAPSLAGYDAQGRIVVYQVYDAKHWHLYQWVIGYSPDGTIEIDRFEGRLNSFTGRTIYRYSGDGRVERAESFDSMQRRVYVANFRRNVTGEVSTLFITEYDRATGVESVRRVVDGPDSCQSFLESNFFVYRWFFRK